MISSEDESEKKKKKNCGPLLRILKTLSFIRTEIRPAVLGTAYCPVPAVAVSDIGPHEF